MADVSKGMRISASCYLMIELTLEYVQADPTELINVGVVDLGQEANLGRNHGVIICEEQLELEDAAYDITGLCVNSGLSDAQRASMDTMWCRRLAYPRMVIRTDREFRRRNNEGYLREVQH